MSRITFPSNTKEIIDQMRGAIGRNVTFVVLASSTACPSCGYDPITRTSTDSFCETCSGEYWIPIYSGYTVSGHITWGKADILNWQSGGQQFDGDCRVQIEYSTRNIEILDITDHVIVDNKILEIKKKILRGVRELNRILLDLIEREKNE